MVYHIIHWSSHHTIIWWWSISVVSRAAGYHIGFASCHTTIPSSMYPENYDKKNHILGMVVYHLSSFTCCPRGKQTPLLINQPMGKGHLCMQLRWFLPNSAINHQLHGAQPARGGWHRAFSKRRADSLVFLRGLEVLTRTCNHLIQRKSEMGWNRQAQTLIPSFGSSRHFGPSKLPLRD